MSEEEFQDALIVFLDSCDLDVSRQILVMMKLMASMFILKETQPEDFNDMLELFSKMYLSMRAEHKKGSVI